MCEYCGGVLSYNGILVTLPEGNLTERGLQQITSLAEGFAGRAGQILNIPGEIKDSLRVTVCARKTFAVGLEARQKYLGGLGIPVNPRGHELKVHLNDGKELRFRVSGVRIVRNLFVELTTDPVIIDEGVIEKLMHFLPTSLGGDPINDDKDMQKWIFTVFTNQEKTSSISKSADKVVWL